MSYNGIEVGDTVRRIDGSWNGHHIGFEGVVTALEKNHLRFGTSTIGHAPQAHIVIKRRSPIDQLINRTPKQRLL